MAGCIASSRTRIIARSIFRSIASSRHGFVADVEAVAIPAAAGVGEVEELVEVDIKIGLGEDAQLFIVVIFPKQFIIIF